MIIFPSELVAQAVQEMSKLPGIGKKTALRLVLHLLKQEENFTNSLTSALQDLRSKTQYCQQCHNIADSQLCQVCSNTSRDRSVICVVENIPDVLAIENTGQYRGLYHILGGLISPIEGIGPEQLHVETLVQRAAETEVNEVILAISATMEGETTAFYLARRLKDCDVKLSSIARGIPVGSELEYTDEVTLGRSILARTRYQ
jgi:recombination protein RecR